MQQHHNCYEEIGEFHMTGKHPSVASILTYQAGFGALHFGVTKLLVHYNARPWTLRLWEGFTIGYTVDGSVMHNYRLFGDRLFPPTVGCLEDDY
jgi:hypothetical protein